MELKKKLLLIDGHALFYRAFHAIPNMTGPGGFPTGAIFGFLSMLFKALVDIKPTHALVTFDMPGKTFRDEMATDYKATRKPTPPELTQQLPKLKEILAALDIPVYEKAGYEADDILGIIAHKTPKDVLNMIVTGDLDLLQLIDNRTHVYRFKIGFTDIQIFDIDKMIEVYGLHPSQWVDYKAIRGDTSDNIPGVPGIGEKGALELIKTFGSLDGVYEAVERLVGNPDAKVGTGKIKPGTLKKLIEGKGKAYLSYKLAHIDQKNHFDFNFADTLLDDYDRNQAQVLLHALGIKALDNRMPSISEAAQKELKAEPVKPAKVSNKPNHLIQNEQQALVAAYLLDPGHREYDTSNWAQLAEGLKESNLLKIYQEIELPLMPILAKMTARGIKLDLGGLATLSKKLGKRIDELTKQIHKMAKMEFNIASPIQLREVLFEKLQIPTDNIKKTGKTKALSTGAEQLEKLRGLHPIIELIFEYRELTKLKSTYVDSLPELVGEDGRIHTTYNQTISAHGRLSSVNPNLQNIPIKTDLGNEVRKAFVADQDHVLLSLDYSQIELRIAASLSGDEEMMKIFSASAKATGGSAEASAKAGKSGGDFHTATASRIFGVKESEVTPKQRRDAKTINFSILYGVSAFGLSERSEMERGEAAEYIKKYYEAFPQLKAYINGLIQMAHQDGMMTNPLGRLRHFPDIHSPQFAIRSGAERAAVNMPLQSLAADMMKMAIIEVDKKYPELQMLLTVHDELVFEVRAGEEQQWAEKLKPIMESVYMLRVPVVVEAKAGKNWREMEKLSVS